MYPLCIQFEASNFFALTPYINTCQGFGQTFDFPQYFSQNLLFIPVYEIYYGFLMLDDLTVNFCTERYLGA